MLQANVDRKHEKLEHSCSNPNCRKVFSRPKKITYYVCPFCQTLIDMDEAENRGETQPVLEPRKSLKDEFSKSTCIEKLKEKEATETKVRSNQPKLESTYAQDKKPEIDARVVSPEQIYTSKQAKIQPAFTPPAREEETKKPSAASSDCQYGFGYLSQREKGEEIPNTCIECPWSLNCLLFKYHKPEEAVKEIKKWYNF